MTKEQEEIESLKETIKSHETRITGLENKLEEAIQRTEGLSKSLYEKIKALGLSSWVE